MKTVRSRINRIVLLTGTPNPRSLMDLCAQVYLLDSGRWLGRTITAGSAGILTNKLLQLCNGAVYDEDKNVIHAHGCKITALLETIEQLGGQHAIICYNYKHDKDRILVALRAQKLHAVVYEGVEQETAWNAGQIELLRRSWT